MRLYFAGIPQIEIAKKVGVDQSTVSLYSSQFKEIVEDSGLLAAGKELGVFNEVDNLRSLSVELYKSRLTVEEAKQGYEIIKAFLKLGISPEQHLTLIRVCQEVGDPGFVNVAVKLSKIEDLSKMSYEEIVSRFERVTSELPVAENKLREAQAKLKSTNNSLMQKNQELVNVEAHMVQLQKEAKAKEVKLEQEFSIKMKKLNVQYKEVETVAKLKTELCKQGLDLPILLKLAKEFK